MPSCCAPDEPAVEDITIRNCVVRGFYQGIRLERRLRKELENGACNFVSERQYYPGYISGRNPPYSYDEEYAFERTALYDRAPKRVRIVDSTMEMNGHAGIYVIAYSQFFSIEGTTVRNNGSVGIYLSHETRYNTIDRSQILHNGWGSSDLMVRYRVPGLGAAVAPSREGIAIDSSAHNTCRATTSLTTTKAGSASTRTVERHIGKPIPLPIRKQHSNYNRIVHNTIAGHVNQSDESNDKSGYGIWLATRQGQKYVETEGETAHCRDPYVSVSGQKRNHDYANYNTIAYNRFEDNWCSVRVGDDFNQIVGNEFHGDTKYDLYIGNDFRGDLGFPVRGTQVVKNRS